MDQDPTNPQDKTPTSASVPEPPRVSKEESILQAAASDIGEVDERPMAAGPVVSSAPKKSHKKLWLSIITIVVIAAAGVGAYMLLKKPAKVEAPKTAADQPAVQQVSASYIPNTVPYAYRAANADPYTIYYRPAAGGERKEVMKLERDEYPSLSDTVGSTVVFGSDTKLYVSQDSGKTYKVAYTAAGGEAINSVKISFEGTRIAVAVVPDFSNQSKGQVFSIDLNGKNKKSLFDDASALYLIGWSEKKQSIAYWQGCYACDGGRTGWKLRNLKADTARDLVKDVDPKTFYYEVTISSDMSTLMYIQTTYDPAIKEEGPPGYYSAAPYKVMKADLNANNGGIDIATVGKKQEKNTNGTEKIRHFSLGFLAGTTDGYYAEGTKLNIVSTEGTAVLYQSDQDIVDVYFASEKSVIVATGNLSTSDYALSNYDITAKKSTQIFQGDANTSLFGITTK